MLKRDLGKCLVLLLVWSNNGTNSFIPNRSASTHWISSVRVQWMHANSKESDDDSSFDQEASTACTDHDGKRRAILSSTVASFISAMATIQGGFLLSNPESVSAATTTTTAAATTPSSSSSLTYISPDEASITQKVFFNVRISRQDGTFYVRDDLPDTPENRVFYGRLVVGLFGKNAPTHVERFLSYIPTTANAAAEAEAAAVAAASPLNYNNNNNNNNDNPLPSYGRSLFTRFDQATGLLVGGVIPSLQVTEVSGSTALQYYGRLLAAPLWIEQDVTNRQIKISHSAKGLLTHAQLDVTPQFGITTRQDTTVLNGNSNVFGRILLDESSTEFLSIVQDLPTYGTIDHRPTAPISSANEPTVLSLEGAASALYSAQRNFFRSTAKSLGDTRLDKVYEGKLLRRVEVTQVGIL